MQVLEPLIRSPRLPHYVQQLQEVLAREHGLRQKFYEEITEDQNEVLSPSTEKNDREVKFEDYAAHSVGEYWIVDPEAERIEKFVLAGESFTPAGTFWEGNINSAVIAGFEIPVAAVFHREANLAALRRLLS